MLKYFVAGGALLWLIFIYGESTPTPQPAVESSPPAALTNLQQKDISDPQFWLSQAQRGTKLWTQTLAWCQQVYQSRTTPTVSQGLCTLVLSANAEVSKNL